MQYLRERYKVILISYNKLKRA